MRTNLDFSPPVPVEHRLRPNVERARSCKPRRDHRQLAPYDTVRSGEDEYRIAMAVAGFTQDELTITQEQSMLFVSGQKANADDVQYLHRGIAGRSFQRRFELADHVRVVSSGLVNGLLTIDLKREIPEAMKPRQIEIATETALPKAETKRIEAEKHAA